MPLYKSEVNHLCTEPSELHFSTFPQGRPLQIATLCTSKASVHRGNLSGLESHCGHVPKRNSLGSHPILTLLYRYSIIVSESKCVL